MALNGSPKRWLHFLILIFMVGTMLLISNMISRRPAENVTITKLRTIFKKPVNFTDEEVMLLENGFKDQEHPLLSERLRTHWIHKPSPGPLKLSKMNRTHYSQHGQSEKVDALLHRKTSKPQEY